MGLGPMGLRYFLRLALPSSYTLSGLAQPGWPAGQTFAETLVESSRELAWALDSNEGQAN